MLELSKRLGKPLPLINLRINHGPTKDSMETIESGKGSDIKGRPNEGKYFNKNSIVISLY